MVSPEQFPVFRLATQVLRQLSSPIAANIKEYAKRHPAFGRAVCMQVGRRHRALELRFKLWSLRVKQPRRLPPLSDAQALDSGADIIGEAILFTMLSVIILYEVDRKAQAKEDLELADESRVAALRLQLDELRAELALQHAELLRLHAALLRAATAQPLPGEGLPARAPAAPAPPERTLPGETKGARPPAPAGD